MTDLPTILAVGAASVAALMSGQAALQFSSYLRALKQGQAETDPLLTKLTNGWHRKLNPLMPTRPYDLWAQTQKQSFQRQILVPMGIFQALAGIFATALPTALSYRILTDALTLDPNIAALIAGTYLTLATVAALRNYQYLKAFSIAATLKLNDINPH